MPRTVVETVDDDDGLESVASGAGTGIIPEVWTRNAHPELSFVALEDTPPVIVRLALAGHVPRTVRRDSCTPLDRDSSGHRTQPEPCTGGTGHVGEAFPTGLPPA